MWALIALGGSVVLMLLGWAMAGPAARSVGYGSGYGGMMPWAGMMGGGGWMGTLMPLMALGMLLFWAAVILGLLALIRRASGLPGGRAEGLAGTTGETDALEVARRRYARGEITRDEYQHIRDDLAA
jgi:putative membrane protein